MPGTVVAAEMDVDAEAIASKAARKAEKKRLKAEAAAAAAAAEAEAEAEAPTPAADEEEEQRKKEKKEKKEKKKQAKREKKEAEEKAAAGQKRAADDDDDEEEEKEEVAKEEKKGKASEKSAKHSKSDNKSDNKPSTTNSSSSSSSIKKNFYQPSSAVSSQSAADVAAYRSQHAMDVSGEGTDVKAFNPIQNFSHAGIPSDLLKVCKTFTSPTPIQSQSWPILLSGRDGVFIAKTGSGKTIAFGIPGLVHVRARGPVQKGKPFMLVIAPTRELAMQTAKLCEEAGAVATPPIRSVCIYGGVSKGEQRKALQGGVHVVVATPGRLLDLMEEGVVDLSQVSFCVLDEADRMLDMGFEKDVRRILAATHKDKQTLMFSATWPQEVQALGHSFLHNPVRVTIGSAELAANKNVEQIVEVVQPHEKEKRLVELLEKYHKSRKNRVLIFVLYKKEAERVENLLKRKGWAVDSIHGDKSQDARTRVLESFRAGTTPLMIATDVAARGLDIPQIEVVINVTFPLTIEDYVHRIGRTGRADHRGISHTLFTVHDKAHAGSLANVLREAGFAIPESLSQFGLHTKKKVHKMYGDHFRSADEQPMQQASHVTFDDEE